MKKTLILLQLLIAFAVRAEMNKAIVCKDDTITIYLPNGSVITQELDYYKVGDLESFNNIEDKLHLIDSNFFRLGITEEFLITPRLISCDETENKYNGNVIHNFIITNRIPTINYSIEKGSNNQALIQAKHKIAFSNEVKSSSSSWDKFAGVLKESQLQIYFDSLSQLEELATYNWDKIYHDADSTISDFYDNKRTRESFNTTFSLGDNDNLQVFSLEKEESSSLLIANIGFGAEFLKGYVSSDIRYSLGLRLPRKRRSYGCEFGVLVEDKIIFNENGDLRDNVFIGVYFGQNLSNRKGRNNWTVIEFGISTGSSGFGNGVDGEVFDENTWCYGISQELSSFVSIYGRFYYEPQKEILYPSLGIRYNL